MGERNYEVINDIRGERDKWFEILTSCKNFAEELKFTITKRPKSMSRVAKSVERDGIEVAKELALKENDNILSEYDNKKLYNL